MEKIEYKYKVTGKMRKRKTKELAEEKPINTRVTEGIG